MPPDDPLFERLRALPEVPLEGAAQARVLRQARAVLVERQPRAAWHASLERLWSHAVAPSLVTVTVAAYVVWAVRAASALYR